MPIVRLHGRTRIIFGAVIVSRAPGAEGVRYGMLCMAFGQRRLGPDL